MNRSETSAILTILKTAYPQFYRGIDVKEAERTVSLWHEMFKDDPVDVVAVAVKAMIASRTNTFPPNIGEIKEEIAKMRSPNEMTAIKAWGLVAAATRNSLYNAQAEFDRLPPTVQRLVGSPLQLREWATMDADTVYVTIAVSAMFAFALCFGYHLDLMAALGIVPRASILGTILTGLTLMGGSSAVAELIARIKGNI